MAHDERHFVVGGYGEPVGAAAGLVLLTHDLATDTLTTQPLISLPSPSFVIAPDPMGTLFCVSEESEGAVYALRWNADRTGLEVLSRQPSHGSHPCHVAVHPSGFLVTANYTTGTVAVHPIEEDSSLGPATAVHQLEGRGPHRSRQEGPHAHMVTVIDGELAVADLGSDRVWRLGLDDRGRISELGSLVLHPGSGPRQVLAAHRHGSVHVLGELDGSVTTADWPPGDDNASTRVRAAMDPLPSGTLSAALISGVEPGTLVVTHRGADTVVELDARSGAPVVLRELASRGRWPRHAQIAGDDVYVANQLSSRVTCLRLRRVADAGEVRAEASVPSPSCLARVDLRRSGP